MALSTDSKFEGKLTFDVKNDMWNFGIFSRALESFRIRIFMGFFYLKQKINELKTYRELFVMKMKNDAKLEE